MVYQIEERVIDFNEDPNIVPKSLDESIEKQFSEPLRAQRQSMFETLQEKRIRPSDIILLGRMRNYNGMNRFKSSTKYKGVSKNGGSYQCQACYQSQKFYACSIGTPIMAAKIYDVVSIQSKCLNASTNFNYTKN